MPKGGGNVNLLQEMADEGEGLADPWPGMAAPPPQARAAGAPNSGIQLTVEEKVSVKLSRDGGLQGMEVKGDLQLLIVDAAVGKCLVPLTLGANPGFQFKTHPNVNKQLFSSNSLLALKDPSRAFPTGSALGVLKWRLQTSDESQVPLLINCWPTQVSDDTYEVNVEYELNGDFELRDVRICIPMAAAPSALTVAAGEAAHNKRDGVLMWSIPIIDGGNASATVEFTTTAAGGADAFFPIQVSFSSPKIFCELEIGEVRSAEDESPLAFSKSASCSVESYAVV